MKMQWSYTNKIVLFLAIIYDINCSDISHITIFLDTILLYIKSLTLRHGMSFSKGSFSMALMTSAFLGIVNIDTKCWSCRKAASLCSTVHVDLPLIEPE